jgi:hypothetical protein
LFASVIRDVQIAPSERADSFARLVLMIHVWIHAAAAVRETSAGNSTR